MRSQFDVALVFSTKYEPPYSLLEAWRTWRETKARFFGYHRDLPPPLIARTLSGDLIYGATRKQQWIAIIDLPHAVEARGSTNRPLVLLGQ
jgi:hypothetical protein